MADHPEPGGFERTRDHHLHDGRRLQPGQGPRRDGPLPNHPLGKRHHRARSRREHQGELGQAGECAIGATHTDTTWYFAEGTTREGFDEYLCIQNPGDSSAKVQVYYLLSSGQVFYSKFNVSSKSRVTVDARRDIGDAEFSIVIDSSQPVVAERPMYFVYKDSWRGGHDVMGASAPGKEVYLAEGTTLDGFDEYVCMMNPNKDPANVVFEIQVEGSSPITTGYTVAPHSRYTVNMNETVGPNKNISIKATSDVSVVIERPMYFNYAGKWRGGHCVVGYMP